MCLKTQGSSRIGHHHLYVTTFQYVIPFIILSSVNPQSGLYDCVRLPVRGILI